MAHVRQSRPRRTLAGRSPSVVEVLGGRDHDDRQRLDDCRGRLGGWGVHVHALGCGVIAYKRGTIQSPAPPPKSLVETIDLVLLFQSLNATELKTKWQWPLLLSL